MASAQQFPRDRRLGQQQPPSGCTSALPADEAGRGANQFARTLHPETARLAALSSWDQDSAVRPLFEVLRDLQPLHAKLADMKLGARPYEHEAATELGQLIQRPFDTGRFGTAPGRRLSATGLCLTLLHHVEDIRNAWIEAKLASEGLRSDIRSHDEQFHARYDALSDEAASVEAAWTAFRDGARS